MSVKWDHSHTFPEYKNLNLSFLKFSLLSSIETLSHFLVYNLVVRFVLMIFATKPLSIKVFISIKRCIATENIDIRKLAKMSNKPPIRILKICKCVF